MNENKCTSISIKNLAKRRPNNFEKSMSEEIIKLRQRLGLEPAGVNEDLLTSDI